MLCIRAGISTIIHKESLLLSTPGDRLGAFLLGWVGVDSVRVRCVIDVTKENESE